MKTSVSTTFDPSILPERARQELHDFYSFLVGKYASRPTSKSEKIDYSTAASLAASPVVGIWKDRDLTESATFARTLRDTSQHRNLS